MSLVWIQWAQPKMFNVYIRASTKERNIDSVIRTGCWAYVVGFRRLPVLHQWVHMVCVPISTTVHFVIDFRRCHDRRHVRVVNEWLSHKWSNVAIIWATKRIEPGCYIKLVDLLLFILFGFYFQRNYRRFLCKYVQMVALQLRYYKDKLHCRLCSVLCRLLIYYC